MCQVDAKVHSALLETSREEDMIYYCMGERSKKYKKRLSINSHPGNHLAHMPNVRLI
jgi:hypothetical protein